MKSNEIEIRFGKISKEEYDNLLNNNFNKVEETDTVVIQQNNKYYEGILEKNEIKNIKMKNKKTYKVNRLGNVKVVSSTETITNDINNINFNGVINFFRFKKRISKYSKDFLNWRFDFTQVFQFKDDIKLKNYLKKIKKTEPTYEFEIEWIGNGKPTEKEITDVILKFKNNISLLIKAETNINFKRLTPAFSIELNNFYKVYDNCAITDKADGERYGIYFDKEGNMYRFGRDMLFEKIGNKSSIKKTLLDTELVNGKYYIFDMMINDGVDIMRESLDTRYKQLKDLDFTQQIDFTYTFINQKIKKIKMNYNCQRGYNIVTVLYNQGNFLFSTNKMRELLKYNFINRKNNNHNNNLHPNKNIDKFHSHLKIKCKDEEKFFKKLFDLADIDMKHLDNIKKAKSNLEKNNKIEFKNGSYADKESYRDIQDLFEIKTMVFPKPGKVGSDAKKVYKGKYPYELDGLIYTPINKPYWTNPYKWKPQESCTIDFLIKTISKTKTKVKLCLFIVMNQRDLGQYNYKISPSLKKMFNITDNMKFIPYPFIPNGNKDVCTTELTLKKDMYDNIPIKDDTIVEFKYNFKNKKGTPWLPIHFREDKQKIYEEAKKRGSFEGMNGIRSALSAWDCIENPITEKIVFSNTPPKSN